MKQFLLFCILYIPCSLLAQGGGDCFDAHYLCDKTNFAQIETQGAGLNNNEILGNNCGLTEFNSTWFTWICDQPGNLTFDLIPSLNTDDVDFIVYHLPSGIYNCDDKVIMRCMASSCNGATGLSATSNDTDEQPGCSFGDDNYLEDIQLISGEAYALYILSFSGSGIFDLIFDGSATFQAPIPVIEFSPDNVLDCPEQSIQFNDASTYDAGNIIGWEWNFGAGAIPPVASGPGPHNVSWQNDGSYMVELTLTTDDDCVINEFQEVEVNSNSTAELTLSACANSSVEYQGVMIAAGDQEEFTYALPNGCDSILTVQVDVVNILFSDLDLQACAGETVVYDGSTLQAGESQDFTFISSTGCDSVVTVNVESVSIAETLVDVETCPDEPFPFAGEMLEPGTTNSFVLSSYLGCDSAVVVTVNAIALTETELTLEACPDETVSYENQELAIGDMITFVLESYQGCDSTVVVDVIESPPFDVSFESNPFCENITLGSVEILEVVGQTAPYLYSLDGNNFQLEPTFTDLSTGTYELTVIDDNQCQITAEVEVSQTERVELEIQDVILGCTDTDVEIRALPLGDPAGISLLWADGTTDFTFTASEPGVQTVQITDACTTYERQVEVIAETENRDSYMFIPNIFSPNQDGINDRFEIFLGPDIIVESFEFKVFNRWGANVFSSSDPNDNWDGRFKGKIMDMGTYIWYMDATLTSCRNTFDLFEAGDVVIFR